MAVAYGAAIPELSLRISVTSITVIIDVLALTGKVVGMPHAPRVAEISGPMKLPWLRCPAKKNCASIKVVADCCQ